MPAVVVATGLPGPGATITVGSVATLAAGSAVTVNNVGTSTNAVFNFGIPQGQQGIQGIQGPAGSTGAAGAAGPLASWLRDERSWAPVAVMTPNVAPGASVYSMFM